MESFLKELAERMVNEHDRLDELTFVFPNRRAALYFEHHLATSLKKPMWAPRLLSIEEYFKRQSKLMEPDRLTLIYELHKVYSAVLKREEAFDRFYFWGEMLLRDFDEIDKYMVNAGQLFKDLSKVKELDETFDYLTDEQKKFLKSFWIHFADKESVTKKEFLDLWQKLTKVYLEYVKGLKKEGLGYEGMIHRDVADGYLKKTPAGDFSTTIFAGFNALTKAEAVLISSLVKQGARVFWDSDEYYVNDPLQEAGQFMRQYRDHSALKSTFTEAPPLHIKGSKKKIELTGVPLRIGQAKLAGEKVAEVIRGLPEKNLALDLARTVVVLPDESLLLPVLHSLPEALQDINVTMGFPLRETPLFGLLDLLVEMQLRQRKGSFSHREVTAILGHAYFVSLAGNDADELRKEIVDRNWVYIASGDLKGSHELFNVIFKTIEPAKATAWLLEVVQYLGASFASKQNFDREYAYHFYQHLSRLDAILAGSVTVDWRGYQKLFRQVIQSQKIPFSGEPLRGLQIMGVLETRNLDFDNVIFLSLNEGQMPSAGTQGSYLPFAIRKAYGLPTIEHRDAIYAYLFYRLLQRSKNIYLYYNTEPDILGNGEMSRFVKQLLLESELEIKQQVLHNPVHVHHPRSIEIPKTEEVIKQLNRYIPANNPEARTLSPSHLNDYLDCGLRFYLKHVARLLEADQVDEDVDARIFGTIIHNAIHWFYEDLKKKNPLVNEKDLRKQGHKLDELIDRAFRDHYRLDEKEPVVYEGQRVLVREMAKTFLSRILVRDAEYAPFEIGMLEENFSHEIKVRGNNVVKIGGTIDRTDLKEGVIRLVDYKTGRDESQFESIESLFRRDSKRNRAAFQTLHYAYAYHLKYPDKTEDLLPGLINRKNLFDTSPFGLLMGKGNYKNVLRNVRDLLPEYGKHLEQTVHEIFDDSQPFKQTTHTPTCDYCAYKSMCRR